MREKLCSKNHPYLEPLLSEPPLIGAISLTFLVHPDVEYQLNGLAAVANAPGVKSAVQRAVNDAIATYLVMPNRIDIPIATLETNALHFRYEFEISKLKFGEKIMNFCAFQKQLNFLCNC